MDEANGKLMGAHGYCTQEMVNLLLGGRAVSNVFNDTVTLDGAPGEKSTVLQGVSKRSDVGLLSLFEHYRSCQVIVYTHTWICSSFSTPIFFSVSIQRASIYCHLKEFSVYCRWVRS